MAAILSHHGRDAPRHTQGFCHPAILPAVAAGRAGSPGPKPVGPSPYDFHLPLLLHLHFLSLEERPTRPNDRTTEISLPTSLFSLHEPVPLSLPFPEELRRTTRATGGWIRVGIKSDVVFVPGQNKRRSKREFEWASPRAHSCAASLPPCLPSVGLPVSAID